MRACNDKAQNLPLAWIASILLLALLLRAVGIDFGLPFWLVNDELPLIGGALRMLELRNLFPSMNPAQMAILYYPIGLPWLYLVVWAPMLLVKWALAGFVPLQSFADRILSDFSALWIASRFVSVAFSVATVAVVMRLSADIFRDRWAAVVTGLLMATSFHHAMLGHFARVWPATLFFWWFGFWAAWRVFSDGRRRDYVLAACASGAGFIVNFIGVLVSVAVAVAHLARHRRLIVDRAILYHAAIVAAFILIGFATSWPSFLRLIGYSSILRDALTSDQHQATQGFLHLLGFYAGVMATADPWLVAVGILGLPILCQTAPVFVVAFAVTMAPYLILVLTGYADDDRYVLPLTPLFAIAAGGFVTLRHTVPRNAAAAVLAAIIMIQAVTLAQLDRLMLRPDTRQLARAWFDDNVPANEGVMNSMRSVTFEQTKHSIELERELAPNALTYLQRRLLAGADVLAGGGGQPREAVQLRITGLDMLRASTPEQLLDRLIREGYKWYIVDDLTGPIHDGRFEMLIKASFSLIHSIEPGEAGVRAPIFNLTNQFERGGPFDLFRVRNLGPRVDIYRLH